MTSTGRSATPSSTRRWPRRRAHASPAARAPGSCEWPKRMTFRCSSTPCVIQGSTSCCSVRDTWVARWSSCSRICRAGSRGSTSAKRNFLPQCPDNATSGRHRCAGSGSRARRRRCFLPRDDAQPRARPDARRGDPRARRFRVLRPHRLGDEAAPVRAPYGGTRGAARAPRGYDVPDRRAGHPGQGARDDRGRGGRAAAAGARARGCGGEVHGATPAAGEAQA